MVAWTEAVDEYLGRQRDMKRAESTIKIQRSTLSQTAKMLDNKSVGRTTAQDIENVLWSGPNSFSSRCTNSTVNARLDHIRAFIRWCENRRYISKDVTYSLKHMKVRATVRRRLDGDLLLDALDAAPTERDRFMLALATFCGQRISDLREFLLRDVYLETNEIDGVLIKNNKEYYAKFGPELKTELDAWLAFYAQQFGYISAQALIEDARKRRLDWYLVPRLARPRLGGYATIDTSNRKLLPEYEFCNVYPMLRKVFATVGIEDARGEGFHTLRRSAARLMYNRLIEAETSKDRAMRMVQVYLNHSNMALTEKYVGISLEKAALNDFVESTPMLGDLYAGRYSKTGQDNVVPFRKGA